MKTESEHTNIISLNAYPFASTFYFLQRSTPTQKKIKRACKQPHTTVQGFVRTSIDRALNVNRLEQTVCGLQTVVLRTNSSTAYNIKIKRNFLKGGFEW